MSVFKDPDTLKCRICGKRKVGHQHHVVYKQEVRKWGGDVKDSRNALGCDNDCHFAHHHPGLDDEKRIELRKLRDENFEFAVELMGSGPAYNYLRRHYRGEDPRLDALLN